MADETQTPPAEPTIESLKADLAAERLAKTGLEELHTALQTKYDDEVTAHQATQAQLAQAETNLADAGDVVNEQHASITELTAQLEKLQTEPAAYPTITVDKAVYEVQIKNFQYKKVEYTVADLLKDKALQKELVKKGVGFLVPKTA